MISANVAARNIVALVRRYMASPEIRWSGVGNREFLAGVDEIGILDLVTVGFVDALPLAGVTIDTFCDLAQRVATLDRVHLPRAADGSRRRCSAGDVREVCGCSRPSGAGSARCRIRKIRLVRFLSIQNAAVRIVTENRSRLVIEDAHISLLLDGAARPRADQV